MVDLHKEILVRIRTEIDKRPMQKGMNAITRTVYESRKNIGAGMERITQVFKKNGVAIKNVTRDVKKSAPAFQGWALSFLFAGMIIKRAFETVAKASINTFMKITEGQTTASRAVVRLSAAFEFLKYSIGKAFATLIENNPWIAQLIDWFSRLIQDHPTLAAGFIITGVAIGLFLMTVGQLVLFIAAVPEAMANLRAGLALLKPAFKTLSSAIDWAMFGLVTAAFFSIALAVYLAKMAMDNDLNSMSEKWGGYMLSISAGSTVFGTYLLAMGKSVTLFGYVFSGLFFIFVAIIAAIIGILLIFWPDLVSGFERTGLLISITWNEMLVGLTKGIFKTITWVDKVLGKFSPFKKFIEDSKTQNEDWYGEQKILIDKLKGDYNVLAIAQNKILDTEGNMWDRIKNVFTGAKTQTDTLKNELLGPAPVEPGTTPANANFSPANGGATYMPSPTPAAGGAVGTAPTTPAEFGANFARDMRLGQDEFNRQQQNGGTTTTTNYNTYIDSLNLERGQGESNEDFLKRLLEESNRRYGPAVGRS